MTALIAVLMLVLAACGGDPAPDTDPGTETTPDAPATTDGGTDTTTGDTDTTTGDTDATTAPPDGEPVEITLWFNGETVPPDQFASLEEEHNIVVNYDIRGDDIFPLTLQMQEAGEPLPELIEIDTNLYPAFIEAGTIEPMTEQIQTWEEEDPELYATVLPSVWEDGTVDGEIYHMAAKAGYDMIYYNIEMLEESGVEVPLETWDDVLEAALQIQETYPDLSEYFGTGGTSPDRMFYWSWGFGVPFDGNKPELTSEPGIEMITWLDALFDNGLVNPAYMIGEQDESQGAFIRGDLAILHEGANGGLSFESPEFSYGTDWGTHSLPVQPNGEQMAVPRGFSMTTGTENPYEAGLVMRYMMEPENAIPRFTELLSSPIRSSAVLESQEVAELMPYFTEEIQETYAAVERQIPPGVDTLQVGEILLTMLNEITVTGVDETPEEIAARYQAELDALGG